MAKVPHSRQANSQRFIQGSPPSASAQQSYRLAQVHDNHCIQSPVSIPASTGASIVDHLPSWRSPTCPKLSSKQVSKSETPCKSQFFRSMTNVVTLRNYILMLSSTNSCWVLHTHVELVCLGSVGANLSIQSANSNFFTCQRTNQTNRDQRFWLKKKNIDLAFSKGAFCFYSAGLVVIDMVKIFVWPAHWKHRSQQPQFA